MNSKKKNIEYTCQMCGHREMLTEVPHFCGQCGGETISQSPQRFSLEKPEFLPLDVEETSMYEQLSQYAGKEKIIRKMCKTCDARESTYGDCIECNAFHQFLIPKADESNQYCEKYKHKNRIVCPVCHHAFSNREYDACPICHQYERHTNYDVQPSLGKFWAFLLLVIIPIAVIIGLVSSYWYSDYIMFAFLLIIFPLMYLLVMTGEDYLTNTTSTTEWRITPPIEPEEDEDENDEW
jgi:uncharacterized CHY-type Zn-finger protein